MPAHLSLAVASILALIALATSACTGAEGGAEGDGPLVVATTSQIAALVREVAGDDVAVQTLLAPGVDPHDFEPSPRDIARVASAAVVLRNGLGLDETLDDAIEGSGAAEVVTVTDGIKPRPASRDHDDEDEHEDEHEDDDHDHGDVDPHVWHDPANVQVMVTNIANALAAAFPEQAATFEERAAAYRAHLDEVDAEIR
ncbi:MAG: metal ABC transporter substrate-binding protein, partial [Dehalococcoidia bacterium]